MDHDQGQDWEYFQLNPLCSIEFIDQGDSSFLAVVTVKGQDAFSTGDLLAPHPSKTGHWKIIGRLDDQIMLLTGEVINPVSFENMLNESPHITAAVIFGRSRVCMGVLLELAEAVDVRDTHAAQAARHLVWSAFHTLYLYGHGI
ncbi:hypothetical protein DXG01_015989 [Tephrocybe rancida]|nr:hypothetical protein DXG01_015989 [Tephrocybe rancida]